MRPDETIEAWARARARAELPAGFADRVMGAVAARRPPGRLVPAAVLACAAVFAALRVAAAFAVFVVG